MSAFFSRAGLRSRDSFALVVSALLAGLLVLAIAGCDSDDADGPTSLQGPFEARTLVGQLSAEEGLNLLEAGGALSFSFEENGAVSGLFVVPAQISESGEVEEQPLAGTYDLDPDGTLRFDFDEAGSSTFIGTADIDWQYDDENSELLGTTGGFRAVLEPAPVLN